MGTAVKLQTNDPEKQLSLHNLRHAGDPNYLVADLRVRSRGLSCDYEFYFDRFHADRLVLDLERMDGGAAGDTVLKQEWGSDHLRFQKDALGRVAVSGELVAQGSDHHFAFKIETDQTVLKPLIDGLREALATAE